jgi:two-component system response regulator HydG
MSLDEVVSEVGGRIVVVDDDDDVRRFLTTLLDKSGHDPIACADGDALRAVVGGANGDIDDVDVVLLDIMMPRDNGLDLLSMLRREHPTLPVIMLTASPDAQSAIDALKAGAYDYLLKPVRREPLLLAVRNAVEKSRLRRELRAHRALQPTLPAGMVARSPAMVQIVATAAQVAHSAVPVLITGDSGSGKEVVAHFVHERSKRTGAFVAVNCAALPAELIDSELFGHEKGAFTGADRRRRGRFEEAHGGTLFLDEIAELPLALQPKLLRVLQEREVLRVGGDRVAVDVRVVAATNVDLEAAVKAGRFRADLLYRLDVIRLRLPPLLERVDDIVPLASALLSRFCREERRDVPALTAAARRRLMRWRWPGNVRELDNVVRRSLLLLPLDATVLDAADIRVEDGGFVDDASAHSTTLVEFEGDDVRPWAEAKDAAVLAFEREYLMQLMRASSGNLTEAGRRAGVDRSNLRRLLVRNGLSVDAFRDS